MPTRNTSLLFIAADMLDGVLVFIRVSNLVANTPTLRAIERHSVHLVKKLLYLLGPAFGRLCSCYGAGDALFGYAK